MPYELGALIDSTRTITVHAARPTDGSAPQGVLSAIALRQIVARDPVRSRAFQEMSMALQHVRHDGLLPVIDLVEAEGRPVAIAPLSMGATLSRALLLPQGRLRRPGFSAAARVVLDAARAAQVIHAARPDLRPLGYLSAESVWVTAEGRALLLPSARCAPVGAASAGRVASWTRFRAPEGERCGESADVYSLAVLLWDLLASGRPPPTGASCESTGESPAWIDPDVIRLVMRALSPDPAMRPADPGAFAAELARIVAQPVWQRDDSALPCAPDDDEKTVPGFVPAFESGPAESDDAATVELPLRTSGAPAVRFAVVAPLVRAAAQPAVFNAPVRPAVPRPAKPRSPQRPPSPKLRVVEPGEGHPPVELALTNEPRRWVVGRAASAHLVVADPDMSREHFAISWEGEGRYRVHDLGSKNGLFVNGRAATDLPLTPGDEVRAGATRLRFEA